LLASLLAQVGRHSPPRKRCVISGWLSPEDRGDLAITL
jgi:hypothetical protein